ncbi:MAG: hypothetical protein R3343_12900 [Nitriliruptorales bacterium]|nr:hypothetical protein [Nitriliruptorales bacterium]
MSASAPQAKAGLQWDDRLFEEVWERHLNVAERHGIAMRVLRRQLPDEIFEARVATELSRQWRRRARNLAVLYMLWTIFWAALTWKAWDARGMVSGLTVSCVLVGVAAVAVCFGLRRYLRDYSRRYP